MPRIVLALIVGGCAPHLACEDAVGDVHPACRGTWSPPENQWPSAAPPEGLEGEGMAPGQVVLDVRGLDQHGDELSLWQFWGRHVLVDISTMWCGPCQKLAMGTEALYQEFVDDGVVYLTVLHENEANGAPTQEELEVWAGFPAYHPDPAHPHDRITAPIISDFKGRSGSITAVRNNQYPVALLVGPDLRVIERVEPVTEGAIHAAVERALGR